MLAQKHSFVTNDLRRLEDQISSSTRQLQTVEVEIEGYQTDQPTLTFRSIPQPR